METNIEIWKDVPGYEGLYQVSDTGNVRSVDRFSKHYKGGVSRLKGKLLIKSVSAGYLVVGLTKSGKTITKKVHRLVCISFYGINKTKNQVNHKNGIKTDNHVDNLEWCSASENVIHAHKTGLHKGSHYGLTGKRNPNRKPVSQYTMSGKVINSFDTIKLASKHTGIYAQNISSACNGKYKQAGGFIWKHKE